MSAELDAGLELGADGWCMLHFPAVAGVAYKAPDVTQALDQAPLRLAEELAWLEKRGLGPELPQGSAFKPGGGMAGMGDVACRVVETTRTRAACATGDTEAFLAAWAEPLGQEQLSRGLAYLDAARADLLEITLRQDSAWLNQAPSPGCRTPREVLHHLADAELFYLVRLEPTPERAAALWREAAAKGSSELDRLTLIRQRLAERLNGLDQGALGRITVHDPHAERWTAAKVLYRAIWHQRHHARALIREY